MGLTNQCLVFDLPSGGGGMPAGMARAAILGKLRQFAAEHGITFQYRVYGLRLKVWLQEESHYTLFFMVCGEHKWWRKPYIIDEEWREDG